MHYSWLAGILLLVMTMSSACAHINVGDRPPDFLGVDRKGNDVFISTHRGKVVVLSFWASWCSYCLKELPVLEKVQRVIGKSRIEVIAVNIDRSRDDFRAMQRQLKNFEFTMARDDHHAVADVYGAHLLPYLLMVGKDGRVAYMHKGYSEKALDGFVDEINKLLEEPDISTPTRQDGD